MNQRTQKVIGANLQLEIKTASAPLFVELLINTKGKLVDFSVICENRDFQSDFISVLESGVEKEFLKFFNTESMSHLSSSPFYKFYWWQLLDEVEFFLNPDLSEFVKLDTSDLLCRCFNISRTEVLKAIQDGANDLLTMTNFNKAGGGCGSCQSDIVALFKEESKRVAEDETVEPTITKFKREKINGLWPSQFLMEKVFPIVEEFNRLENEESEVLQLIEDHLYIRSNQKIIQLEEMLEANQTGIKLFYT